MKLKLGLYLGIRLTEGTDKQQLGEIYRSLTRRVVTTRPDSGRVADFSCPPS